MPLPDIGESLRHYGHVDNLCHSGSYFFCPNLDSSCVNEVQSLRVIIKPRVASIYIKRFVCPVSGDKHFSHTCGRGDKHF